MTRPTIEALRQLVAERMSHALIQIAIPLEDGSPVDQSTPSTPPARADHAEDFSCVNWYGTVYGFTPTQRRIVAVLWNAYDRGLPDVVERTILSEADSDSGNLAMLFRGHPAFGSMIQRSSLHGGLPGCFRLVHD